jgi:peptide/nickel transport system ATP-binding protein
VNLHSFRELDPAVARRRALAASAATLLDVRDLGVSFAIESPSQPPVRAVDGVSFQLRRGEALAIVGESGSGKSVCAMTLMGLTRGPRTTISGSARLQGEELTSMPDSRLRRLRGRRMAMIFQDPQSSLNPVHRVGDQIAEQIRAHEPLVGKGEALRRAAELMERVGIARAAERVRSYPHELSGGQRQRVMIAMALSLGAPLLLADEPTTALDVTVQAQILAELKQLREQEELALMLITHDFGIVADIADRIAVMKDGRIVEQGTAEQVLGAPEHPHTRALLDALAPARRRAGASQSGPRAEGPAGRVAESLAGRAVELPAGTAAEWPPALAVSDLRVEYRGGLRRSERRAALAGVSLSLRAGETLAIVGESGCGKTTLLRSLAGLLEPTSGSIEFDGRLGMVFQDTQASLNPRRRVGRTLERAIRRAAPDSGLAAESEGGHRSQTDARAQAVHLLERVGLDAALAERYPHELSGGQRQRVAIARALARSPLLVLLDEPVSSLDASLRRGVIELLDTLQAESGCAYVVVSHDLGAVEAMADRIAVMHAGEIVEIGSAADILQRPQHPYTRELLAARPRLPAGARWPDRVPSSSWLDRETSPPSPSRR